MKNLLLLRVALISLLLVLFFVSGHAQVVSGTVFDTDGAPIPGVTITTVPSGGGTTSDRNGVFSMPKKDVEKSDSLVFRHLGFVNYSLDAKDFSDGFRINLASGGFNASEVVVSASRYDERLLEATASIDKITEFQMESSPSGDFYQGLDNLKEVHVLSNSLTMNVFNARGFNSSSPFRVVQFFDGMDTHVPALNFSPGNLLGTVDVDLQSIEVITGPSSALYGSNALQGVLTMTSKDPYLYQGITAKIKGGSRELVDAQMRFAKAFGKKERFAIKLVGSYMRAKDWIGDDPEANVHFPTMTAPQNLNSQVEELDNFGDQNYGDFNSYAVANPDVLPNQTPGGTQFRLPGYKESDLFDGKVYTLKAAMTAQYKITDRTRIELYSKYAQATGIYQGNARSYLNDFSLHQHKIEIRDDRFVVRAYATFEDVGNTSDIGLTGVNAGFAGLAGARSSYLSAYVGAIDSLSNEFVNPLTSAQIETAIAAAEAAAPNGFLEAGSPEFNSVVAAVVADPNKPTGARFTGKSNMQHIDAQYNLKLSFLTANVGASWRRIDPRTDGFIFADTLDANGNRTDISYMEYGGFLQVMKPLFNDKLKLHASVRFDKSRNFKTQVSPRGAISFNHKGHYLRAAYQTAFRNPSLNNQYFYLNVGPLIVRGNVSGYDNLYSSSSVGQYSSSGDPEDLEAIALEAVKPERLNTIELGYKYLYKDRLLLDAGFYYNTYSNFIGSVNAVEPNNGLVSDSTGVQDIDTRQYVSYSISANAQQDVNTLGTSIGLKYNIIKGKSLVASANYTFTKIFDEKLDDNLIPGFNTPSHKLNIGLSGRRIYKGLGFSANFSWVDAYEWRSPYSDKAARVLGLDETMVPSYHTLDIQVWYELDKIYSTFRLGASNIYNNKHVEIWGGPKIGAMVYASWLFDLKFK
jgi:iron complex outermembrane receptor protein